MNPTLPGALAGRFEVVRPLGQGSFGLVLEVRDRETSAARALKLVEIHGDGERELRELTAFWKIRHPRVLRCFEGGRIEERLYLLLELAEGTVAERIGEPGSMAFCWEAIRAGAEGAAALHGAGLIHRDLKPSNIMLTAEGPKLGDLGLVRVEGMKTLTRTGMILGTPGYLAPEQARGERATPATDAFALGAMLYQVVEGRVPFPGDSPGEVLAATARARIEPLRLGAKALTEAQRRLLLAALDPDPARRPADLAAFAAGLGPLSPTALGILAAARAEDRSGEVSGVTVLVPSRAFPAGAEAPESEVQAGGRDEPGPRKSRVAGPGQQSAVAPARRVRGQGSLPGRGSGGPRTKAALALAILLAFGAGLLRALAAPVEVEWEVLGDALRVRFSSWVPGLVGLEVDGVAATPIRTSNRGRTELLLRGLARDPPVRLRLVGPGSSSPEQVRGAGEPAIGSRVVLGAPGRLRLEVLRPCQARWEGAEAWTALSGNEREIEVPKGASGPTRLEWDEGGIGFGMQVSWPGLAEATMQRALDGIAGIDMVEEITRAAFKSYGMFARGGQKAENSEALDRLLETWRPLIPWVPDLLDAPVDLHLRRRFFEEYDTWFRVILSGAVRGVTAGLVVPEPPASGTRGTGPPPWPGAHRVEVPLVPADGAAPVEGPLVLFGSRREEVGAARPARDDHDFSDVPRPPGTRKDLVVRWPTGLPGKAAGAALVFEGSIETYCEISMGPDGASAGTPLLDLYELGGLDVSDEEPSGLLRRMKRYGGTAPEKVRELAQEPGGSVFLPIEVLPEPGSLQRLRIHSMRGDRYCNTVIGRLAVVWRD